MKKQFIVWFFKFFIHFNFIRLNGFPKYFSEFKASCAITLSCYTKLNDTWHNIKQFQRKSHWNQIYSKQKKSQNK